MPHLEDVANSVVAEVFAVALEGLQVVAVRDGPTWRFGSGAAVRLRTWVFSAGGAEQAIDCVVFVAAAAGDSCGRQRGEDRIPVGEILYVGDVANGVVAVNEVLKFGA